MTVPLYASAPRLAKLGNHGVRFEIRRPPGDETLQTRPINLETACHRYTVIQSLSSGMAFRVYVPGGCTHPREDVEFEVIMSPRYASFGFFEVGGMVSVGDHPIQMLPMCASLTTVSVKRSRP